MFEYSRDAWSLAHEYIVFALCKSLVVTQFADNLMLFEAPIYLFFIGTFLRSEESASSDAVVVLVVVQMQSGMVRKNQKLSSKTQSQHTGTSRNVTSSFGAP